MFEYFIATREKNIYLSDELLDPPTIPLSKVVAKDRK